MISPYQNKPRPLEAILAHPPAPLFGISSLFPPYGTHVNVDAVEQQYKDAIAALSERLSTDKWFLGSPYVLPAPSRAVAHPHPRKIAHRAGRARVRVPPLYPALQGACAPFRGHSPRQPRRMGAARPEPGPRRVPCAPERARVMPRLSYRTFRRNAIPFSTLRRGRRRSYIPIYIRYCSSLMGTKRSYRLQNRVIH